MLTLITYSGVAIIVVAILAFLLPGFKRQNETSIVADYISKSEGERKYDEQNRLFMYIALNLQKKNWLDAVLGADQRRKYEKLDRPESYEFFIGKMLFYSVVMSAVILPLYLLSQKVIFLFLIPVAFIAMIWASTDYLNGLLEKRDKMILKELPNLFDKMIIALEVGRPLENILTSVSEKTEKTNPVFSNLLKRLVSDSNSYTLPVALQIFSDNVSLPIVYNFVSIVNVIREKGFHEAESDLLSIHKDMRDLKRISTREKNRNKPAKMNFFTIVGVVIGIVFMIFMSTKIYGIINVF